MKYIRRICRTAFSGPSKSSGDGVKWPSSRQIDEVENRLAAPLSQKQLKSTKKNA